MEASDAALSPKHTTQDSEVASSSAPSSAANPLLLIPLSHSHGRSMSESTLCDASDAGSGERPSSSPTGSDPDLASSGGNRVGKRNSQVMKLVSAFEQLPSRPEQLASPAAPTPAQQTALEDARVDPNLFNSSRTVFEQHGQPAPAPQRSKSVDFGGVPAVQMHPQVQLTGGHEGDRRPPLPRKMSIILTDALDMLPVHDSGADVRVVTVPRPSFSRRLSFITSRHVAQELDTTEDSASGAATSQMTAAEGGTQGIDDSIQRALQWLINALQPTEMCRMIVELDAGGMGGVSGSNYLALVSSRQNSHEFVLLTLDKATSPPASPHVGPAPAELFSVGIVLPLFRHMSVNLKGDGTFSVETESRRRYAFKTSSVRSMWSTIMTVRDALDRTLKANVYDGAGPKWVAYYEHLASPARMLRTDVADVRPESPEPSRAVYVEAAPGEPYRPTRDELVRELREVMMHADLDDISCKDVRDALEAHFGIPLGYCKEFIDEQMMLIVGQMDPPSKIFDHLYLGSEWNASNKRELETNGVGYVLNMALEIDNFFPGNFEYHHCIIHDEPTEQILPLFDATYKFIKRAKDSGSKLLVHCKMGVSRSATAVIAYAMKANNWTLQEAYQYVRSRRACVRPNAGFLEQLREYEGILRAARYQKQFDKADAEAAAAAVNTAVAGVGGADSGRDASL
eukprot:Opistho-2@69706